MAVISECADAHVAMWTIAWELANMADLSDVPTDKTIAIRANLASRIHSAMSRAHDITPEEIKRILETGVA